MHEQIDSALMSSCSCTSTPIWAAAHECHFFCTWGTWVAVHEYDGFLSKATHAFWVSHVVICCSWTFMFFLGYSWLLSFSFFLFPAHVCFAVRLLMPFEFPMLSFVAHEFLCVFCQRGYSWLLSFSRFDFLLMCFFVFLVRLLMPFEFLMLLIGSQKFLVFFW